MPDETTPLLWFGTSLHDKLCCLSLMLAQHGLTSCSVFHIEENPMLQGSQEVSRLKERLDCETVAVFWSFLPPRHVATGNIPCDSIPVFQEVRDIEKLGHCHQFRRFPLIAFQLSDALLDGVRGLRVFVLHDSHRHAIDHEHHIGTAALSGRRFQLPFPSDMEAVGTR